MFSFNNARAVVTLFHKPNFAPSMRALALLKQTAAEASETATIDQASEHSHQNKVQRADFDLDVMEQEPTQDQLRSILEYVGSNKSKDVVDGASSVSDALRKLKEDKSKFKYPVVVDWNNGKASKCIKLFTKDMLTPPRSLATTSLRYSNYLESFPR